MIARRTAIALTTVLAIPVAGRAAEHCGDCPPMVTVPAGTFVMGAPEGEVGRFPEEGPVHAVKVPAFSISATPITRAEYAAFVSATRHADASDCAAMTDDGWKTTAGLNWKNPGFAQTDDDPVVCVSWDDAKAYVAWLSSRSGKPYR